MSLHGMPSIQEMTVQSCASVDPEIRHKMWRKIALAGAGTVIENFAQRLEKEMGYQIQNGG
jgi:actin-related protein